MARWRKKHLDEMAARLVQLGLDQCPTVIREHRWRTTSETLHVNGATGEMISPSGQIDGDTIAEFEHRHAASVARNRARFVERPES